MELVLKNLRQTIERMPSLMVSLKRDAIGAVGADLEYAQKAINHAERLWEDSKQALAVLEKHAALESNRFPTGQP